MTDCSSAIPWEEPASGTSRIRPSCVPLSRGSRLSPLSDLRCRVHTWLLCPLTARRLPFGPSVVCSWACRPTTCPTPGVYGIPGVGELSRNTLQGREKPLILSQIIQKRTINLWTVKNEIASSFFGRVVDTQLGPKYPCFQAGGRGGSSPHPGPLPSV